MELPVNCYDPFDPVNPHHKQALFLSQDYQGKIVKRVHFVCGRGTGKTIGAVLLALRTCLQEPGITGLILSPTYQALRDIFLSEWERIVPPEIYVYNKTEKIITVRTGREMSRLLLRSRQVDRPEKAKDVHRGITVGFVIDDEAAIGFDEELYVNVSGCIRAQTKHKYYACTTTPRLGNKYYDVAHGPGHKIISASSRDNPWLPEGWVDDLMSQMSPAQARREIDGQWVALEGLIWDTWSDEQWPMGNVHDHTYNPDKPWFLFADLGVANGAYVVVQPVESLHMGHRVYPGATWVAVAELTPEHDGSASRAFQRLKGQYGTPAAIVAGYDVNKRSDGDATKPMFFANQVFGSGIQVRAVADWHADKQTQYNRLLYLIKSATGERRFCVSKDLQKLDPCGRGIMQLMQQDTWPDNAGKARGTFLPKEGRLEHMRDALLYGAVELMSPPSFGGGGKPG
jgi:hypothetical protein